MKNLFKISFAKMQKVAVVTLLALAVLTATCNRKKDVIEEEDEFCSCLNVENFDKAIPFVDEFLGEMSKDLDDARKLQELTDWLNAQPCVIDASVLRLPSDADHALVLISFNEKGTTKEFVLEISMSNPPKVAGYREFEGMEALFCPLVNVENFDRAIPFVDGFLSGLSDDLDVVQKLADWLNAQPCIIKASVFCLPCIEKEPPTNEILFSFEEDGMTKEFILEIATTDPPKVAGYREYKKVTLLRTAWKLIGTVDAQTGVMKELLTGHEPRDCSNIDPYNQCYTLYFPGGGYPNSCGPVEDNSFNGMMTTNAYCGKYEIDYETCAFRILRFSFTSVTGRGDEGLYIKIFNSGHDQKSFTIKDTHPRILRLYYNDGNNFWEYREVNYPFP